MRERRPQSNRIYGEEIIARIEDLCWNQDKGRKAIARELNLKLDTVANLMQLYAISKPRPPYRLPKFDKWDFSADNVDVRHG